MLKILLVGEDFRLLATRAAVLAKTGASTVCCNPLEMMRDLARESFHLVVLCHSMTPPVAEQVADLARRWWPEAKIVLVMPQTAPKHFDGIIYDALLHAEPSAMMRETMEVLRKMPGHLIQEVRMTA